MNQQQKGGYGSTNIQIDTVVTGLSYSDVREIASGLFRDNFANLMAEARSAAATRAEEIRDEIIGKLELDPKSNPESFSQVEKQVMLLEAQKAYAVSGDEELKSLLVHAVVNASSAPERSKKFIVIGESIKIAPLLTKNQIKALGIAFAIRFVNFGQNSLCDLFDVYVRSINLNLPEIDLTAGDIRHMEYLGCGSMGISSLSMWDLLNGDYHGLLSLGFSAEQLKVAFAPDPVPLPMRVCPRDVTKLEIATHREDQIDKTPWNINQKAIAKQKIKENLIDEQTAISEIEINSQLAGYLYKQWSESNLNNFALTSTGIAIGYTYIAERVPNLADLDIWL